MSAPRSDETPPPPSSPALDDACIRFEAAWRAALAGGTRPRIEDHLADTLGARRAALLRELVLLDVTYRRRAGEQPRPEDYLGRFPDLGERWLARWTRDRQLPEESPSSTAAAPLPSTGPLGGRLRCPHCRNPIQVADDHSDEVLCPGCGGSFRLRDARRTETADPTRPLGKFQLLERVGTGAFGAVWKARDTTLDRVIALKIPHSGLLTQAEDLERFGREARAAAQLRHPGIVTVHEVATIEGLPVIVADFVTGVPLKDLLEVRRLTFREAAALVADIAEAVDYAHRMGVVHRDLKPANVMIAYETRPAAPGPQGLEVGRPLVMDFGLALRMDADATLTADGHVLGTPAYMSPEQAAGRGHEADARSDVYSLGVIFYEMLTGELPFRGSRMMLLVQVLHDEPRPPRKLNDRIPRDLETVCLKCLEKEPGKRYAGAGALAEDLRRYLRGEPVAARPAGTWERAVKWARRRPAVAALLAVVVLVFLFGAAGSTYFGLMAVERAKQADAARRKTDEALGQAEAALAQSYARPLGYAGGPLGPAELDALWEVAGSDNERVRLLFLAKALDQPEVAARLGRRAEEAAHAAVGLDPGRRQAMLEILKGYLTREDADPRAQTTCALLGAALRFDEETFARQATDAAVEAMTRAVDPPTLRALGEAVATLAPRLGSAGAVAAVEKALGAMDRTPNPGARAALGRAVAVLAGRVGPAGAAVSADKVLDAIARTTDPDTLKSLGESVRALAGLLDPAEAAAPAGKALAAVDRTTDPHALAALGTAVAGLAQRTGDGKAAAAAARKVLDRMGRTTDPTALQALGRAVVRLAPRVEPEEAARTADQGLEALIEAVDAYTRADLAEALAALAPRLEQPALAAVVRKALEAMSRRTTDPDVGRTLGVVVTSLARRMTSQTAADAVDRACHSLVRPAFDGGGTALVEAVASLCSRMDPGAATAMLGKVLDVLPAPPKTFPDSGALPPNLKARFLARTLVLLAPRMGPEAASALLEKVVDAVATTSVGAGDDDLLPGLAALARRVDSAGAAAVADKVVAALDKPGDSLALRILAEALLPLIDRLDAAAADRLTPQVLDRLKRTADEEEFALLGKAMAGLAGRMSPEKRSAAAEVAVLRLLERGPEMGGLYGWKDRRSTMEALAARMSPPQRRSAAAKAREMIVKGQVPREDDLVGFQGLLGAVLVARVDLPPSPDLAPLLAKVLEKMVKTADGSLLWLQGKMVEALAPGLDPAEAASAAGKVLDTLGRIADPPAPDQGRQVVAPGHPPHPFGRGPLIEAVAALAARMEPTAGAGVAARALDRVDRDTHADALVALGESLAQLAPRLPANAAGSAADKVLGAMDRTSDLPALQSLANALAALAARMEPAAAGKASDAGLGKALSAISRTAHPNTRLSLGAMAALVPRVSPGRAAAAARQALDALGRTNDLDARKALAGAVAALSARMDPDQAALSAGQVLATRSRTDPDVLPSLDQALAALVSRATTPDLVELLKHPTCLGEARRTVLQELGGRAHRPFEDLWDLVRWLRDHEPDRDLSEPPRRPVD